MAGRIVIVSDLHLGRPHGAAVSPEALRPLWQDAEHLIVNGDAAEIHHPQHWTIAARSTLRLFDLCETDGVELTLVSGNHDPYISDLRHLHLAGDQVFLTHGDVLHPAVAPWSPASARIRKAHEVALAALEPEERNELEMRLMVSQQASTAEWRHVAELEQEAAHSSLLAMLVRPWALMKVLVYWRIFPRLAAEFAREHAPEARFAVLGHTHHAGVWEIDGITVINTGSFGFPGKPHAIIVEDRALRFVRIRRAGDVYALDSKPVATFELQPWNDVAKAGPSRATDHADDRTTRSDGHVTEPAASSTSTGQ